MTRVEREVIDHLTGELEARIPDPEAAGIGLEVWRLLGVVHVSVYLEGKRIGHVSRRRMGSAGPYAWHPTGGTGWRALAPDGLSSGGEAVALVLEHAPRG